MEKGLNDVKKLTRSSMLLVFALVIIFIGARFGGALFNQIVVGPLVNAVILTAVLITDLKFGVLVSLLTPVLAFITGQFQIIFFVPFIMIGNILLALTFGIMEKYIKRIGLYLGIVVGASIKTLFLIISVKYFISLFNLPIPGPAIGKLADAMSYPQLYTALAGGVIAILFKTVFDRANK